MNELNSNQRKILSQAAQTLKPVIQIGQNGLTDAVLEKIDQTIAVHELIKVKFLEFKEEKHDLSREISESCQAALVRIIGNIAIFYRPAEKQEKRKFNIILYCFNCFRKIEYHRSLFIIVIGNC